MDTMPGEITDEQFLQRIDDSVRVGSTLFSRDDVIRMHKLAARSSDKMRDDFDLPYYRLPKDYVLTIVREARQIDRVRKVAEESNCKVVASRGHLTVISSKRENKVD